MSICSISGIDLIHKSVNLGDVGEGTYGTVSLYDTPQGKLIIKKTKLDERSLGYAVDFLTEIDMLLKLRAMSNVVKLYDMCFDIYGKKGYIVMEPLTTDLKRWYRTVSIETRITHLSDLIRGVGGTLAVMNSFTLIHNDIKPNNILVRVAGDELMFKLSDFGKSARVTPETVYGGIDTYVPPGTRHNVYFVEYWAFLIVLMETIIGKRLNKISLSSSIEMSAYYKLMVIDNKFPIKKILQDNLSGEQYALIPDIFWKFVQPLICCDCYNADNNCAIVDGFVAAGVQFSPTVVAEVAASISRVVPDQPVLLTLGDEFKKRIVSKHPEVIYENFRRLVNKFFSLDTYQYDEITIKRYAEVALIIALRHHRISGYKYFSDVATFIMYQRHFLSTIDYQIIII